MPCEELTNEITEVEKTIMDMKNEFRGWHMGLNDRLNRLEQWKKEGSDVLAFHSSEVLRYRTALEEIRDLCNDQSIVCGSAVDSIGKYIGRINTIVHKALEE